MFAWRCANVSSAVYMSRAFFQSVSHCIGSCTSVCSVLYTFTKALHFLNTVKVNSTFFPQKSLFLLCNFQYFGQKTEEKSAEAVVQKYMRQ